MKILSGIFFLMLLTFTTVSEAGIPPKYLSVPYWQSCTSTTQKGSAQFVCLPSKKPNACPVNSWRMLTSQHMLKRCPSKCGCGGD